MKKWDITYYAEKLKESLFDFTEEDLKPYFSLDVVLKGLFSLLKRLFGIDIVELSSEEAKKLNATTWHKDVKLF